VADAANGGSLREKDPKFLAPKEARPAAIAPPDAPPTGPMQEILRRAQKTLGNAGGEPALPAVVPPVTDPLVEALDAAHPREATKKFLGPLCYLSDALC